jgi:hypothetical protein
LKKRGANLQLDLKTRAQSQLSHFLYGTFTGVPLVEPASSFLPLVLPRPQYCPPTRGARSEIISDAISICFPIPNRWGPLSRSHFPNSPFAINQIQLLSPACGSPPPLSLPPTLVGACIPLPSQRHCAHHLPASLPVMPLQPRQSG